MDSQKFSRWRGIFALVGSLAIVYSAYLAVCFSNQLPLDQYAFRQTQTALTSYWFIQEGFRFAYQTPVAGAPWSIPFEFPLYQLIVALVSSYSGVSLDSVGRVVSYVCLLGCLIPIRSITSKLGLDRSVFYIFSALIFSSPIYVYWGRSFMIETTALLFSILAIKVFVDALVDGFRWWKIVLFSIYISISMLQKSTTALPVVAVLLALYLFNEISGFKSISEVCWGNVFRVVFFCFVVPVFIGWVWVEFTDVVKNSNPLGHQLTSGALSKWNWGSLDQRGGRQLFVEVLWGRIVSGNLGGWLGAFLIAAPFLYELSFRKKVISLVSIILGLIPIFIFTNLHIVHSYYQSANVIFLLYALAVSLGEVCCRKNGWRVALLALTLIMWSNYSVLSSGYLPIIKASFGKENRDVAVGDILRREIPDGGQFIAFGNDWSSTFSYIAGRKSFTAPEWFKEYSNVLSEPERFVDNGKLAAVVSCSDKPENVDGIFRIASKRQWKIGETHGCLIATPATQFALNTVTQVKCRGNIDFVKLEQRGKVTAVSVAGWSTM